MPGMTAPRLRSWLAAAVTLASQAAAQGVFIGGGPNGTNVLNNTCNRLHHQSALKDGSLWIDGGVNTFVVFQYNDPLTETPNPDGGLPAIMGQNQFMIQVPMNDTWIWRSEQDSAPANISEIAHVKANSAQTNTVVPIVEQGALFQGVTGDSRIWLFGGFTSYANTSFADWQPPQVDQYSLWSMNTTDNSWIQHDVSRMVPMRVSNGANADAPDMGLGFWLDGSINSGSSDAARSLDSYHTIFDPGLIVLNFNSEEPTAKNISTAPLGDPRAGGSMQYVPNYGTEGILVMIGGGNKSVTNHDGNNDGQYIPLTDIWVYDVAAANASDPTTGFHFQAADGEVPSVREDFCVVGASAPDNSSYTIYVYGGRQGDSVWDDIYALSLPAFTWSKIYSGTSPRFGHTCHRVNNRQMITSGGSKTTNLTDQCDWETRGVAIYDLPSNVWGFKYIEGEEVGEYAVPAPVYQTIGGNSSGFATMIEPTNGFSTDALAQVIHSHPTGKTDPSSKKGLSGGAIAGIVIGVVAALLIAAALVFFLVIRPRRQRAQAAATLAAAKHDDEAGTSVFQKHELDDSGISTSRSHDGERQKTEMQRVEADGRGIVAWEKEGDAVPPEMAATEIRYEMDATDAEVRAELGDGVEKTGGDIKKGFF